LRQAASNGSRQSDRKGEHGGATGAGAGTTTAVARLHESCGGSSTFAQELLAVSRAFTQCTPRSFIVLDEFGRGTLAADGIALLASFLLTTVVDGSDAFTCSPVILLATHYTEILAPKIGLMASRLVQHVRMSFLIPSSLLPSSVDRLDDKPSPDMFLEHHLHHNDLHQQQQQHAPSAKTTTTDAFATGVVFPFLFETELGGVKRCGAVAAGIKTSRCGFSSLALNCAAMCEVPEYMLTRMAELLSAENDDSSSSSSETSAPATIANRNISLLLPPQRSGGCNDDEQSVHSAASALLRQFTWSSAGGDDAVELEQQQQQQNTHTTMTAAVDGIMSAWIQRMTAAAG
jgi:hypothetical protein